MCILRASGENFDLDAFLEASTLQPYAVLRVGDKIRGRRRVSVPELKFDVSDASLRDLRAQISDAEDFLAKYRRDVKRMTALGADDIVLDFPNALRIDGKKIAAQYDRFPASLVKLAGSLNLSLELSLYPCSDD